MQIRYTSTGWDAKKLSVSAYIYSVDSYNELRVFGKRLKSVVRDRNLRRTLDRSRRRSEMLDRVVLSTFILQLVSAQVQLQPNPLNGIRGQNLTITCTFPSTTVLIQLRFGNTNIITLPKFLGSRMIGDAAVEYIYGPLEDSDDGSMFTCDDLNGNTDNNTLDVLCELF